MKKTASKRRYDNEEHKNYIREHGDIPPDEDYEMGLKDSDRKKLWTLAGNRCSLCNSILVSEDNTIVGEECHISSAKPSHRSKKTIRYDPSLTKNERDSYYNAILLCANCHKKIDNSGNAQYTIEELHKIKEKHEAKVKTGMDESKLEQEKNKEIERENKKRTASENLLSEVEINQKLLRPLYDCVTKVLDGNDFSGDAKFPTMLMFSRDVYSNLAGEFGSLVHQYYSELKHIEEEYNKLGLIPNDSINNIGYYELWEAGKFEIPNPGWHEIEGCLRHAKKVYDMGEELIKDLKE